jgi:hypothetical protein
MEALDMLLGERTGLPLATFPQACPWTVRQILDEDFWLEENSPYDPC